MRVGMNKTKVMISGERQTVRQKAVRWPCGVCSKYEIFLLVCINRVVGYWHGYLSGARCRLAYGPADATATHCLLLQ